MIEPLDLAVKEEIVRLFQLKTKWAIPFFAKVFTGGLHANERAAYVEGFYRMHHKYEHALSDQIECVKRILSIDRCLDTHSKEAFSYYTHPLYRALKENFTPYATSLMVHQLIESYKHIASEGPSKDKFNVKTDRGLIFTLDKDAISKTIKCNCPFSVLNNMICSHAFTLMNALQIKHLGYCGGDVSFWRDEVNTNDPSSVDIIPKNQ